MLKVSYRAMPLATHEVPCDNFLSLKAATLKGRAFRFADLEEKVTVVVNVAVPKDPSQKGVLQSISHFKELGALCDEYRDSGVEVLAFPCDEFSSANGNVCKPFDGAAWCEKMGFKFRMMQKVKVNGMEEHPVYTLLKRQGPDIPGNFVTMFLVVCHGDHCKVSRFDGLPPRALRPRIDAFLHELRDETNAMPE